MESPITIREAVLSVQRQDYLLPSIQREFVWDAKQTEKLFDSLLRGFPIGSFLFWKVQEENANRFKFYEVMKHFHARDDAHLKPASIPQGKALTVILDGQQRLTSMSIALLGYRADKLPHKRATNPDAYPKKRLYLNLAKKYERDDDPDREFDFRFLTDADAAARNDGEYWFPVRDILQFAQGSQPDIGKLMAYTASNQLNAWGAEALGKLSHAVVSSPVIHYFQEDEQSLNRVLNVFVRLNSGGTPLSYSDLLLSIATAQWKTDARETIYGLVDDLNLAFGAGKRFDKDFVLKSALVLVDLPDVKFDVDNFNAENTARIEAQWSDAVRAPLLGAVRLAALFGFDETTLTAANVLIPVAYWLKQRAAPTDVVESAKFAEDRTRIRTWLILALLKSAFSAKTDTLLAAVRTAMQKVNPNDGFPLSTIETALNTHGRPLRFSDEDIDDLMEYEYGRRETFPVLAALYPRLNTQFKFHVDHIFPRSAFHKQKLQKAGLPPDAIATFQALVNTLPNLQLLPGVINEEKLASPFEEWTRQMREDQDKKRWSDYCAQHHIPPLSNYTLLNFAAFHEQRKALLRKELTSVLRTTPMGVT
jgi:hypothetical protein